MKKKFIYLFIIILVFLSFKSNAFASTYNNNILNNQHNYTYILANSGVDALSCSDENVMKVLELFSVLFVILKIAIPIIIIILGIVSLAKVIISDDQSMLSKTISSLVMKIILGIFIFFLPTLISTIIGYIDDADNVTSEYRACTECLLNSNCSGSPLKSTAKKKRSSTTNNTTTNNTTTIDVDGFSGKSGKF
ncbi:MAG: hypothetical protein ACI4XR_00035 [Bacilli bacterium]